MRERLPIDVCISSPVNGGRSKHVFTDSDALLSTLLEWKRDGRRDILLTWGRTEPAARETIEADLQHLGIPYQVPESGVTVKGLARAAHGQLRFAKQMYLVGSLLVIGALLGYIAVFATNWSIDDRRYFGFVAMVVLSIAGFAFWWAMKMKRMRI